MLPWIVAVSLVAVKAEVVVALVVVVVGVVVMGVAMVVKMVIKRVTVVLTAVAGGQAGGSRLLAGPGVVVLGPVAAAGGAGDEGVGIECGVHVMRVGSRMRGWVCVWV